MNLDQRIRQRRLNRRDFLELAGLGIGALALGQCKNSPSGPELPVPVTLQFDVYNHMLGYRTSFTRNTTSGQNVNIKISDFGYGDVDSERISVREGATGGRVGTYTTFSRTGEANFIAPRANTTYGVFLMNKSNGTNYNLIDNQTDPNSRMGILLLPRYSTWNRQDDDGDTGPEGPIIEVINQFNEAFNLPWISYAEFRKVESGEDWTIGYDNYNAGGSHGTTYVRVNPRICDQLGRDYRGVFIEEIFEMLLRVSDIHGDGSHVNEFDRRLSLEGKELMNYVLVRDKKNN